MTRLLKHVGIPLACLLFATDALAWQAGWNLITVAGATALAPATTVALYYPTQAAERETPMGPFTQSVAIGAQPEPQVKGLIMLSHGTGGTELGHATLAQALARRGYLVAALRHPGDNWQDRSLLTKTAQRFFDERPRQISHVIDALLRDPTWQHRIARDAQGPRIGALGHSAGGYSVLALAGGQPDLALMAAHCDAQAASDPIFCSMGRATGDGSDRPSATVTQDASSTDKSATLTDQRVRAVVAMAPVGAVLTAASLAKIDRPVAIYLAENDRFLVPRFHGEWIAQNMPRAQLQRVPNAWHFAFMDRPSSTITTEDGDIAADPPGFDRMAFLQRLAGEIAGFFDKALQTSN
jgi:predicted dienelactone hydrolase